jgi:hypothetical protein
MQCTQRSPHITTEKIVGSPPRQMEVAPLKFARRCNNFKSSPFFTLHCRPTASKSIEMKFLLASLLVVCSTFAANVPLPERLVQEHVSASDGRARALQRADDGGMVRTANLCLDDGCPVDFACVETAPDTNNFVCKCDPDACVAPRVCSSGSTCVCSNGGQYLRTYKSCYVNTPRKTTFKLKLLPHAFLKLLHYDQVSMLHLHGPA